jgi:uncharacterized membrane protein YjjP (DUF1212 family)
MRVGDLLLSAGLSASEVVATMRRMTSAYGLSGVHVDVTYTVISVSHLPASRTAPVTYARVVRSRDVDYSQVRRLFGLANDIQRGLPLPQAIEAFENISSAAHPYPAWVTLVGSAGVAAAVVLQFTASWQVVVATFIVGCVVDQLLDWLDRRGLPPFFHQVAGAILITLVAAAVAKAGAHGVWFFRSVNGNLLVVGGIIMLVAGTVIVAAARDAIDEFYVTASARIVEVSMRTVGIVIGIVIGIRLATALGMPLSIAANPVHYGPLAAQFAGAIATAAFFAIAGYADAATVVLAAVVGCVGWASYAAVVPVGWSRVPANALAALTAALAATLLTRHSSVPGFALVNAAILPLVPGLTLYTGLLEVIGTPAHPRAPVTGAATLSTALGIALGIAAGASLGTYLGRPIIDRARTMRIRGRR